LIASCRWAVFPYGYFALGFLLHCACPDFFQDKIITFQSVQVVFGQTLKGEMPDELKSFIQKMDVPLLGSIPANDSLSEFEYLGKPLIDLGDESPVYQSVSQMMKQIIK